MKIHQKLYQNFKIISEYILTVTGLIMKLLHLGIQVTRSFAIARIVVISQFLL